MDLKKDEKIIGSMYISLKLKISELPESYLKIIEKAKNQSLTLYLQDNVSCLIESYRKAHVSGDYICFEGVNLKF
jgi:hypothetical protein